MSAKHGTTRLKSIEVLALVLLLFFAAGVEIAKAHKHPGYSHDSDTGVEYPDWMSNLPDDMRLSEMSIPGTHDTMAYQVHWLCQLVRLNVFTQTMNLKTQLNAGIREVDPENWTAR